MPLQNFPHVRPTPMVLPTKDYPWLKRLMKEVDFACATCSSAQGQPVYHTIEEAHREPLSSEPTSHQGSITAKGMVATRFLVLCPTCRTVPENNPMMPGGFCDLMMIDKNYKRPFRPQGTGGDGLTYDGDDEADEAAVRPTGKFGGKKLKKTSDLNPLSAPTLTAAQKRAIKKAQASNAEAVPANAVSMAKGTKGKK